jgi:hypothetical protein
LEANIKLRKATLIICADHHTDPDNDWFQTEYALIKTFLSHLTPTIERISVDAEIRGSDWPRDDPLPWHRFRELEDVGFTVGGGS